MNAIKELKSKLFIARKMRNESDTNEVFDYWHGEMQRLTNEAKGVKNA